MATTMFLFAALIAINCAGNSPDYDYDYGNSPEGGEYNECYFEGSITNSGAQLCQTTTIYRDDFYQGGDLTWEILTKACPDLVRAGCADPGWSQGAEHNMTRDLVWDREPDCGQCPRCPCNDGQPEKYYLENSTTFTTQTAFQSVACYECSCNYFYDYESEAGTDIDVYGFVCETGGFTDDRGATLETFSSPARLEIIECPFTTPAPTAATTTPPGCDDGGSRTYYAGEYFFQNDGADCTTYCYCNEDLEPECVTGYDNILSNGDGMKYAFLSACDFRLNDAWNDTSRYYKQTGACSALNGFSSGIGNCPYPLCRTGDVDGSDDYQANEFGGIVYDDEGNVDYELYNCATCNCETNAGLGQDLTDCNTGGDNPSSVSQADACDRELFPILNCTRNNNGFEDTYSSYYSYCGWYEQEVPYEFDPDIICVEDNYETGTVWGDNPRYLCDAFYGYDTLQNSETGECSVTELSFEVKEFDCIDQSWKSETQKVTLSTMCCGSSIDGTPACNQQEPGKFALGEDNECVSNGNIQDYHQTLYECEAGDRGIPDEYMKELYCDVPISDSCTGKDCGSRVCDLIKYRWRYDAYCDCAKYRKLEKMYGDSDYENSIRSYLQRTFDSDYSSLKSNLEAWNEYYECNHVFECDITDSFGNMLQVSIISILFIIFVNFS